MITWQVPGPYTVAFSTRRGGVSEGRFASLNLGRSTADDPSSVDENRRRLCAEVGAVADRLALNFQHHSATVHRARAGSRDERGDGLWTDEPGLAMLALTADCLPLAIARSGDDDPALAVLHVGWRGLLAGIVAAGVRALGSRGRLVAAVGPGIGPCCYDVGDEVAAPFREAYGEDAVRDGRLDLWSSAERALRAAGCAEVERTDLCTRCNPELFFSHRRDDGVTGRQGVIGLVA